jgi:hypothetical protein
MSPRSAGDRHQHRNSYLHSDRDIDRNGHCRRDRNQYGDRDRHRNGERYCNLDSDGDNYRHRDCHRNSNAYGHRHAERLADAGSLRERARTHAPSDHRPDYG